MLTLGINAAYQDSAACLIEDGHIIGAAEEERFNHQRHGKRASAFSAYELPFAAIAWCLSARHVTLADLDHVAYGFDPYIGTTATDIDTLPSIPAALVGHDQNQGYGIWEGLFLHSIANARQHLEKGYPASLRPLLGGTTHYTWHFVPYQRAQAANAWWTSPFARAAVFCVDRGGECATTSYSVGNRKGLHDIHQVLRPHSLAFLCEQLAAHLGLGCSADQSAIMVLSAYGRPRYQHRFDGLIVVRDGDYRIAPYDAATLWGSPRAADAPLTPHHYDLACSLQAAIAEAVIKLAAWLSRETGVKNLALAGGLFHNGVINSALRDAGLFANVWVPPAVDGVGVALGAALFIDHDGQEGPHPPLMDSGLGPQFTAEIIEAALVRSCLPYRRPPAIAMAVAARLADNKIVAWFQGAMECGPRALGGRSLLASPCDPAMSERLNRLQARETGQPCAAAILAASVADWLDDHRPSPFMSFVGHIRPDRRLRIPAVGAVDGSSRYQTVDPTIQPLFHDVIEGFCALTGVPLVLNTTFSTHDRPMVCTPEDAIACFATTPIDILAIGPFLVEKGC
ncbi:MAG: carbamoyltransferase family protein [Acidiferrobacter sp.]